jgi:hypothetical protein
VAYPKIVIIAIIAIIVIAVVTLALWWQLLQQQAAHDLSRANVGGFGRHFPLILRSPTHRGVGIVSAAF